MKSIAKYLFEAGMLKRVKRSGWWLEGIKDPESVAEHSFRTAVLAFIIAKLEGESDTNANKLCSAAVFHDMHETRILDLNKVVHRYINERKESTKRAEEGQIAALPKEIQGPMRSLLNLDEKEKIMLKDADILEATIQAREYLGGEYENYRGWIESAEKRLKTKSARTLLEEIKKTNPKEWYFKLKKMD